MRPTRHVTVLLAAAVTVVLGVTAAPAVAGETTPTPVVPTSGGPQRHADLEAGFAGYVAGLPTATRRVVSGTFTVPEVTCPPRPSQPLFVAIYLSGTTIGTTEREAAFAYLDVTCTAGVASYQATATTSPELQSGAVTPGGVLRVRMTTTPAASVVTITDVRSGSVIRVQGGGLKSTAVGAYVQGGSDDSRFPRFTRLQFGGLKIDDATLATYTPTSFDQVSSDGKLLLETSPLTAGQSFRVTYRAQP